MAGLEQTVTPWKASSKGGFDYTKLTGQFGLELIDEALLARWERVTGVKAHTWLRRGLFYCHQGLNEVLDYYEAGKQIYLYTGRGPSNDMHLGHLVPFAFTKYLQDALKCPLVIEMSDEEKFYFKDDLSLDDTQKYLHDNIKDIIACGFDPAKTFIFSNYEYGGEMHQVSVKLRKIVNVNQLKHIYGFKDDLCIGAFEWPIQQTAPAFPEAFKHIFGDKKDVLCIVPMAIDQSPYFRAARDYAPRLGFPKPAMICGKFLPTLLGPEEKMSSTGDTVHATLFLRSTAQEIETKVKKYAVSGGQKTTEEHRAKGGNLEADMSFQLLTFFEESDTELQRIAEEYSSGRMLTGELKAILIRRLSEFLAKHQAAHAKITDDVVKDFMARKKL